MAWHKAITWPIDLKIQGKFSLKLYVNLIDNLKENFGKNQLAQLPVLLATGTLLGSGMCSGLPLRRVQRHAVWPELWSECLFHDRWCWVCGCGRNDIMISWFMCGLNKHVRTLYSWEVTFLDPLNDLMNIHFCHADHCRMWWCVASLYHYLQEPLFCMQFIWEYGMDE